jgi:hypothetical protein
MIDRWFASGAEGQGGAKLLGGETWR